MPAFSQESLENLRTCHRGLWETAHRVIEVYDHKIIEGFRGKEKQNSLYPRYTKVKWPDSKHNNMKDDQPLSLALDFVPWPIDWHDHGSFYLIAGAYRAIGHILGYNIRLGADWDSDADTDDQRFHDLGHVEIIPEVI